MATTIKLKNSVTTTNAPSSLVQGEVAINITDKKVWVGNAATTPIQLLGDGGSASFTSIAFGAGTVSSPSITFTGDTNTGIYSPAADTIAFTEGGAEAMRIDSSGNLAIGRTSSISYKLDVDAGAGSAARLLSNNAQVLIGYNSTSFNYYDADTQIFRNNAGTERMRITSTGNVGIGTSSPSVQLHVYNTGNAFERLETTATGSVAALEFKNSNDQTHKIGIETSAGNAGFDGSSAYALCLQANGARDICFSTNGSGRMRITTGGTGELIVGGTTATFSNASRGSIIANGSSSAIFQLNIGNANQSYVYHDSGGMSIWNGTNTAMNFATNNTERMRITSGGDLLVGSSSGSADGFAEKLFVSQSSINAAFIASSTSAACASGAIIGVTAERNTTNNTFYAFSYYNRGAAAYKFRIADSGNATNTNGSYGTISDVKLKENIVDATPKLEKINQLKVRNFNFIGDDLKQIGFVAQEFEQVFPSMVEESQDKTPDGEMLGTTTKTIKTTVLIPILVKAIQEMKAIIDEQAARISALESK